MSDSPVGNMVWLVALALLFCGGSPTLHESAFTAKREYVYRYMAQTVSGIPGASRVYSGVKIMTNVRLQFQTASVVIAQMENLELFTMNDAITDQNPTKEQITPDVMTRFVSPTVHKALTKPFTFNYVHGHVFDLETPENEPYWSVNIKRGMVSLLQVNLHRRWTAVKTKEDANIYKAFELSPSGFCATRYVIEDATINPEVPIGTVVVAKTRDFKNCIERPAWFKTMFRATPCTDCDTEEVPAEAAQVRCTLKGTRKDFIILSAVGESIVNFYLYTPSRGHMTTSINQTLYLVDAKDMSDSMDTVRVADLSMVKRSLITFIPEQVIDPADPFASETQLDRPMDEITFTDKKRLVNLMKATAKSISGPEVLKIGAGIPVEVVRVLRRTSPKDLVDIWNEHAIPKPTDRSDEVILRKVLWNTFAVAGNHVTAKLILETCAVRKLIPSQSCAHLINLVALASHPNSTLIEMFMTVATELGGGEDAHLVRALWLGIGALTNKLVYAEKYELMELAKLIPVFNRILATERDPIARDEVTVIRERCLERQHNAIRMYNGMKSKILEFIKSILATADTEAKLLALKTIGNTGLPELLPLCMDTVADNSLPEILRFTAVFSMLKMADFQPRKVADSLLPIFMKTTNTASIRIASFMVIMKSRPPRVVLEMLARHIAREPDLQVSSFMYRYLATTANSTHPCFQKIAKEAESVLRLASKVEPGLLYSSYGTLDVYPLDDALRTGISAGLGIIGSNSSILPKSFSVTFNTHVLGRSVDLVEMGGFTEGLEGVVDKIFGPNGVLTNRKSLLDLLTSRRMKRSSSADLKMEDIAEKLRVSPRLLPEPMGSLYIKLFGYELRYFSLNELLRRLATTGKLTVRYRENEAGVHMPVNIRELVYLGDANTILPTEAGIPVSLRLAVTSAIRAKGLVKAKANPSIFESNRQSLPTEASLHWNVNASGVVKVQGFLSAHTFTGESGVGFHLVTKAAIPLVGNVTAYLPETRIRATIVPSVQKAPVFLMEAYPVTYQTLTSQNQEKVIGIAENAAIVESSREYDALGMNVMSHVTLATPNGKAMSPMIPLTGRSSARLNMAAGREVPDAIVLQAKFTAGSPEPPPSGRPAGVASCDCTIGRLTLCLVACEDEDVTDPQIVDKSESLKDFPDLESSNLGFRQLKSKLQARLGEDFTLSPVGHKWGMIATVDASTKAVSRKFQLEALWQSINREEMHQVVLRLVRSAVPGNPLPWEVIAHGVLQYPTYNVNPKLLLNLGYQTQIRRQLLAMARIKHERPTLASLNDTIISLLKKNMLDLAGGSKPEQLLLTFTSEIFGRNRHQDVHTLLSLWKIVVDLKDWSRSISKEAINPAVLMKHVTHIITKITEVEHVKDAITIALKLMNDAHSVSVIYLRTLQYLIHEYYIVLNSLAQVCERAGNLFAGPRMEVLVSNITQFLTDLDRTVIRHSETLAKIPPPESSMNKEFKAMWPKLEQLSKSQMSAFVSLKAKHVSSLEPVVTATEHINDVIPSVVKTTEHLKSINIDIIPVLVKLTIQHSMIKEALHIRMLNNPAQDRKTVSELQRKLENQISALAVLAAFMVKAEYDFKVLTPVLPEEQTVLMRSLQNMQLSLGFGISKVKSISMKNGVGDQTDEVLSLIDDMFKFTRTAISEASSLSNKLWSSNIDADYVIFEKTMAVIYEIKDILKELKGYIVENLIFSSENVRSIKALHSCEALIMKSDDLEVRTLKSFSRIYSAATQTDIESSLPINSDVLEATLSTTALKQKQVHSELGLLKGDDSYLPENIDNLVFNCRGIQDQINWIQLLGVPLRTLRPMFAGVVRAQEIIIKEMQAAVTSAVGRLDDDYTTQLEDMETQIASIQQINRLENGEDVIGVYPTTAAKHNPVTDMMSRYLPLTTRGYCKIAFGNMGLTPKSIFMKMYASKSFEQLLWESRQIYPLARDPALTSAITREEVGDLLDTADYPVWRLINSLHHRHLAVRLIPDDVPETARFAMMRVGEFFMSRHYWSTDLDSPVERTPGLIHVVSVARMNSPASDWFFMTPNSTTSFYGITSPVFDALTLPIALTRPAYQRHMHLAQTFGPFMPPICKMFYKTVRTFDGVVYTLPNIGTCSSVLAMDCTPARTFAIILRSDTTDFSKKRLSIIAEGHSIEVSSTESGVVIAIDGSPVAVNRHKPHIRVKTVAYGKAAVFLKVSQEKMFHIDLPLLGIYIITDGNYIAIKSSPVFRLKTCGLCSNMDGQRRYEFESPNGRIFSNPEPFIASNIIRGDNCAAIPWNENSVIGGLTCVPKPAYMRKTRRGGLACFSLHPVTRCVTPCHQASREKITVPFYCTRNDLEANKIVQQITLGETPDLFGKPATARYSVMKHASCK